jgi:DNA polymerase-4
MYYMNARGIDNREVVAERVRKSIGAEITFTADISDRDEVLSELRSIAQDVWTRLSKRDFSGRTVTLKVKYADFRETSKRRTISVPFRKFGEFWMAAKDLLGAVNFDTGHRVRLMGLTVSNAESDSTNGYRQRTLDFGDEGVYKVS